jgi:hypothetical protein
MYSSDFNFFLEHQIAVCTTNGGREAVFLSLLNGECFRKVNQHCKITDAQIDSICQEIHAKLNYYDEVPQRTQR